MSDDLLRVYFDPKEIGGDGYPYKWHQQTSMLRPDMGPDVTEVVFPIKDMIRERDGHRCLRCRHPYTKGEGEWSRCDDQCRHGGPVQLLSTEGWVDVRPTPSAWGASVHAAGSGRAQWRILTVHHLNGVKYDCRWWNLVSLCQRCHLTIQGKVIMDRPWSKPHSEWFRPFVAGFYAWKYLDEEISREEAVERMDQLLALELLEEELF